MPRHSLFLGFVTLCLFIGNSISWAGSDVITTVTPSYATVASDGSDNKKPFIITAALREEYDDNIFTSASHKVGSFKTDLLPSIIFDFPMDQSDFSVRIDGGLVYFNNRPGDSFDKTVDLVMRYTHSFSERFSLDLRDQVGYFTEPSLLSGAGTPYRNGGYISNTATAEFNAQWTPLVGTLTTFSSNLFDYQNSSIALIENSLESVGTHDFRFAILPKVNLVFGGIIDNISYADVRRGYTNYTGDGGIDWQALPSLSIGGRAGATFANPDHVRSSVAPYGSFLVDWRLGARSTLNFSYAHNVVPTDFSNASGQEADRFTVRFNYDITPSLTSYLSGIYTHSSYNQNFIRAGTGSNFNEDDTGLGLGLAYHFNPHLDFEAGYNFSDISSGNTARNYTRNQTYVGVRGTY